MFKKFFGLNTEKDTTNELDINDLYAEMDVLKEEIETLEEKGERKEKELKELQLKITVMTSTLREKDEHLKLLLDKIDSLTEKLDKPNNVTEKLFQNLKDRDATIEELKKENQELRKSIVLDVKESNVSELISPEFINYRLLIRDYYEARKFEEFKKICQSLNLLYMDDLKKLDFENIDLTKTKIKNAQAFYDDYLNQILDAKNKIYLLKGSLISEYFFRFRSFVNFCKDKNLTHMIELDNFDFTQLIAANFIPDQVKKIEDSLIEYNQIHRIKK